MTRMVLEESLCEPCYRPTGPFDAAVLWTQKKSVCKLLASMSSGDGSVQSTASCASMWVHPSLHSGHGGRGLLRVSGSHLPQPHSVSQRDAAAYHRNQKLLYAKEEFPPDGHGTRPSQASSIRTWDSSRFKQWKLAEISMMGHGPSHSALRHQSHGSWLMSVVGENFIKFIKRRKEGKKGKEREIGTYLLSIEIKPMSNGDDYRKELSPSESNSRTTDRASENELPSLPEGGFQPLGTCPVFLKGEAKRAAYALSLSCTPPPSPETKHSAALEEGAHLRLSERWEGRIEVRGRFLRPIPSLTHVFFQRVVCLHRHAKYGAPRHSYRTPHIQQTNNLTPKSRSPPVGRIRPRHPRRSRAISNMSQTSQRNNPIPMKGFVHEVLRRSHTSGSVLQTALCYLEAIRPRVQTCQQGAVWRGHIHAV
ncbi:hypothetical protein C8F01DRAFT_1226824 [Mycena amicta]|nr:hypothetical protein C8F01DRAFT_1226824 [Mycena amicta]